MFNAVFCFTFHSWHIYYDFGILRKFEWELLLGPWEEGWDSIDRFNPAPFCATPGSWFPTSYVVVTVYFVYSEWRSKVSGRFSDICGIVDHHCLNFLFIITLIFYLKELGIACENTLYRLYSFSYVTTRILNVFIENLTMSLLSYINVNFSFHDSKYYLSQKSQYLDAGICNAFVKNSWNLTVYEGLTPSLNLFAVSMSTNAIGYLLPLCIILSPVVTDTYII